jgi:GT2 family glycosyltransferase
MTSVIIVSYNSAEHLRQCLLSLRNCEVIVVDNASIDESADIIENEFTNAVLIRNESNIGFGAANNRGLKRASGEFALLLNPDAFAKEGAIALLSDFMAQSKNVIACGGSLWFEDGSLQDSACNELTLWSVFCEQTFLEKLFKKSRLLSPYWVSWRCQSPCKVAQLMGACLMLRRVNGEFPLFDERFFLYCEDTELCKRLSSIGELWYVPEAKFVHSLGASSANERWKAIGFYNRGKELYFKIHRGYSAYFGCFILNRMGATMRTSVWLVLTIASLGMVKKVRRRLMDWLRVLFAPIDPYIQWKRSI